MNIDCSLMKGKRCILLEGVALSERGLRRSIFDYCYSAWACCNKCDAVMLERLQRRAARVVFKVNSSDVALNSLRWSTLEHRRALHVYLLVNKCLKKCVPQFLIDYFTFNRDRCLRRTRQSNLLHVPKVKLETAKRSFYYNGCIVFNSFTCDSNISYNS